MEKSTFIVHEYHYDEIMTMLGHDTKKVQKYSLCGQTLKLKVVVKVGEEKTC